MGHLLVLNSRNVITIIIKNNSKYSHGDQVRRIIDVAFTSSSRKNLIIVIETIVSSLS